MKTEIDVVQNSLFISYDFVLKLLCYYDIIKTKTIKHCIEDNDT